MAKEGNNLFEKVADRNEKISKQAHSSYNNNLQDPVGDQLEKVLGHLVKQADGLKGEMMKLKLAEAKADDILETSQSIRP
jgi:hypothetical protein